MSAFGGPNIIDDGLVLYLDAGNRKSYPGSGTTWFDKSGRGNNGTLTNGPTFNTANLGSVVFDGVDESITVPNSNSLVLSSTGTLTSWCRPNTLIQESFAGLIGKTSGGDGGQQSYYLHWRQFQSIISAGIQNEGTYNLISCPLPTVINWNYFVFTWNGSQLNLYQNGESVATPVTQTINCQNIDTTIDIGGNLFKGAGGNINDFNGNIAITQIYNRSLTSQEVLQNYNATKGRFNL